MRISFRRYKILEVLDYVIYTARSRGCPGLWVLLIGVVGKRWWRPLSRGQDFLKLRPLCHFIGGAILAGGEIAVRKISDSKSRWFLSREVFACGLLFGFAKPWMYWIASVLYTFAPLWPPSSVGWDRIGVRDIAETSKGRRRFLQLRLLWIFVSGAVWLMVGSQSVGSLKRIPSVSGGVLDADQLLAL